MKKLKITKEQYDRIFNSSLINENINPEVEKPKVDVKDGGNDNITKEIKELLKHLYGYTPEFNSEFWVELKGKSSQEVIDLLVGKGLIVKKGRNYIVPKSLGSKEEAKESIDKCLREFIGEPKEVIDEDGGYPAGAEDDPRAPYNQPEEEQIFNTTQYDIIVYNDDLAILKYNKSNEFYLLDFNDNQVDYEGREISEEDLNNYLNNNEQDLEKMLIPLNIEILNELNDMYNLNNYFLKKIEQIKNVLGGLNEGVEWGIAYPKTTSKRKMNDISPKKKTDAENSKILDKLATLKDREEQRNPPTKSKNPTEELEEMTSAAGGSAGGFTAPLGTEPLKREIKETLSVAGAGNFQFDTPGLANIGRNGEFKKGGKKPKAFSTPQWAGGSVVDQPECSKLNNNKEAQNGGCNSGASSLKMKKPSGSINAPTLGENQIFEEIARQTGKTIDEVKQIILNKK
jgi:hypothetical protein